MRTLCRLEDLPDGRARGFGPALGSFTGLFAVRKGDAVYVYVNACPHVGAALDDAPDAFLTTDRSRIFCSNHAAEFEVETGRCVRGPCKGKFLESVPATVKDGLILVPEKAGL